jgi:hypothetical protein
VRKYFGPQKLWIFPDYDSSSCAMSRHSQNQNTPLDLFANSLKMTCTCAAKIVVWFESESSLSSGVDCELIK